MVRLLLEDLGEKRRPTGRLPALREGEYRERFAVPTDFIARVIGKGGEQIRRLEEESGARLRVLPAAASAVKDAESDEEETQEVIVQGAKDKVEDGVSRLQALLEKLDAAV